MGVLASIVDKSISGSFSSEVFKIGDYAFSSCSNLTSVSFPNATSIGQKVFAFCSSLTSVSFPNATSIGIFAFYQCSNLTSVSFPNVTSIGQSAFNSCSGLTNVDIPNATSINYNAFNSCSNLTSVSFPKVTSIDNSAFQYCSNLTSVDIPNATSISGSAFYSCSSLTSISFPNATSIDYDAFRECSNLTSVDIPKVTSIGNSAFKFCSNLTSVDIPNATSIGNSAFKSCSSLTSVSFPNVTSIYKYAFQNCSNLTTIYVGTNTSTVCTLSNTNAFDGCTKLTKIYVPASLVDSYKSATNWSNFANKIVADTIPIGGKIFYDAGDNGATYTFYDSNGNVINDTSISGLQNAVSYTVKGTPSSDRFYVVYPSMLNNGNLVYWGFYRNADIKSSGGNIVNTGEAIGTGKTATQAILNYIDTYASSETASSSRPSSDISQASPNGYNLYKNCGTDYKYLWDVLRDANKSSIGGCNDWFVPSRDEMGQIASSGAISNITSSNYIWSGSAHSYSDGAWLWNYVYGDMLGYDLRNGYNICVVCRAF